MELYRRQNPTKVNMGSNEPSKGDVYVVQELRYQPRIKNRWLVHFTIDNKILYKVLKYLNKVDPV